MARRGENTKHAVSSTYPTGIAQTTTPLASPHSHRNRLRIRSRPRFRPRTRFRSRPPDRRRSPTRPTSRRPLDPSTSRRHGPTRPRLQRQPSLDPRPQRRLTCHPWSSTGFERPTHASSSCEAGLTAVKPLSCSTVALPTYSSTRSSLAAAASNSPPPTDRFVSLTDRSPKRRVRRPPPARSRLRRDRRFPSKPTSLRLRSSRTTPSSA